jgi:S1-C subfamily serine protease
MKPGRVSSWPPSGGALRLRGLGFKRGDIITQADDVKVTHGGDLRRILRDRKPGDTVTLTVVRPSGPVRITVRLAEAPQV